MPQAGLSYRETAFDLSGAVMYRRSSGRRWRQRDLRGIPYEPQDVDQPLPKESAGKPLAATACPECGESRPGDERVAAGLSCRFCED
jgi:hypothetical protein